MAITYSGVELAFECGTDAAGPDRVVDDVVRPGLAHGEWRESGHESLLSAGARRPSYAPAAMADHRPAMASQNGKNDIVSSGSAYSRPQAMPSCRHHWRYPAQMVT
jgi:hypothetical protein